MKAYCVKCACERECSIKILGESAKCELTFRCDTCNARSWDAEAQRRADLDLYNEVLQFNRRKSDKLRTEADAMEREKDENLRLLARVLRNRAAAMWNNYREKQTEKAMERATA